MEVEDLTDAAAANPADRYAHPRASARAVGRQFSPRRARLRRIGEETQTCPQGTGNGSSGWAKGGGGGLFTKSVD